MSVHQPQRPDWICLGCGGTWPCPTRRQQLSAAYNTARVSLSLYLASHFITAAADLPCTPACELYDRFLGWLRATPAQPTR